MDQGHIDKETTLEQTRATRIPEPQGAVTEIAVSTVVFTFDGARLRVMGLARGEGDVTLELPRYQFEGGMSLADAASLAVRKDADMKVEQLFQVGAFSLPKGGADNASIEICFLTITPRTPEMLNQEAGTKIQWVAVEEVERFGEQARGFIQSALQELRKRARFEDIAFSLLPSEFSLSELQKMFEAVMGRTIDVRNFRKKIDSLDILIESAHKPKGVAHRPPRLYSFSAERFRERVATEGEIRFF